MTAEELIKLRDVDVTNVDRDTLVDLQDIRINDKLSVDERIASFIEQIKNEYFYFSGIRKKRFHNTLRTRVFIRVKKSKKSAVRLLRAAPA